VESVDHAVTLLKQKGVKPGQMVIGAAFYARIWEGVPDTNHGLYQPGKFRTSVSYKHLNHDLPVDSGFVYHWDSTAQAPYIYHPQKGYYATFDDTRSISLKTSYAVDNHLGGIMFWQLTGDVYEDGLLDAIDKAKR
jgi:chitinase